MTFMYEYLHVWVIAVYYIKYHMDHTIACKHITHDTLQTATTQ